MNFTSSGFDSLVSSGTRANVLIYDKPVYNEYSFRYLSKISDTSFSATFWVSDLAP